MVYYENYNSLSVDHGSSLLVSFAVKQRDKQAFLFNSPSLFHIFLCLNYLFILNTPVVHKLNELIPMYIENFVNCIVPLGRPWYRNRLFGFSVKPHAEGVVRWLGWVNNYSSTPIVIGV